MGIFTGSFLMMGFQIGFECQTICIRKVFTDLKCNFRLPKGVSMYKSFCQFLGFAKQQTSPWVHLRVMIALTMRHCYYYYYYWNGLYALNWLDALDSQLRILLVIIALSATQMTFLIFLICVGFFACFSLLKTHSILMFYIFPVKNMKYAKVATGVV